MKNTFNIKDMIHQLCTNIIIPNVHVIGEQQCEFGHEEADVNIITYVHKLIQEGKKKLEEQADDNDIFVLLLYFFWKWQWQDIQIKMKSLMAQ